MGLDPINKGEESKRAEALEERLAKVESRIFGVKGNISIVLYIILTALVVNYTDIIFNFFKRIVIYIVMG